MKKIYNTNIRNFWDAFGLKAGEAPVISFVGAGGKTSLIKTLSAELSSEGICHGIMTTTHMWPVDAAPCTHLAGAVSKEGKMMPPEEGEIQQLLSKGWPVLIEADGSKGLPCKAPEAWEPVIRPETTHVFALVGAACLGKPVDQCCHRPGRVMALLKCPPDHLLTLKDLALLAADRRGLRKGIPAGCRYGLVINQVDRADIYEAVRPLKFMLSELGIEDVWFVCMNH